MASVFLQACAETAPRLTAARLTTRVTFAGSTLPDSFIGGGYESAAQFKCVLIDNLPRAGHRSSCELGDLIGAVNPATRREHRVLLHAGIPLRAKAWWHEVLAVIDVELDSTKSWRVLRLCPQRHLEYGQDSPKSASMTVALHLADDVCLVIVRVSTGITDERHARDLS